MHGAPGHWYKTQTHWVEFKLKIWLLLQRALVRRCKNRNPAATDGDECCRPTGCGLARYDHVRKILRDMIHWLQIRQRVVFKLVVGLLAYLRGTRLSYFQGVFTPAHTCSTNPSHHRSSPTHRTAHWTSTGLSSWTPYHSAFCFSFFSVISSVDTCIGRTKLAFS